MKITNILIGGVCMLTLAACNDYLDVDVPSKSSNEDIYTSETETSSAIWLTTTCCLTVMWIFQLKQMKLHS